MRLDPITGLKICTGCKESKVSEDFNHSSYSPDGLRYKCRECETKAKDSYRAVHRERINSLGRVSSAKYYAADPRRRPLKNSYFNAKKAGVPNNLTLADIHIPEFCPLTRCGHRRLTHGTDTISVTSPSLDRFNPSLGYVQGNVWIICQGCNRAKQDMSGEDHVAFGLELINAFKEYNAA